MADHAAVLARLQSHGPDLIPVLGLRYVGASIMYLLSKYKLNKKYGITEPREQLYAAVDHWVDSLGGT